MEKGGCYSPNLRFQPHRGKLLPILRLLFIGSGIAVASSASAALGAISEDGSLFGKSMIFVAMAEGIALYGLIISFMILGKL